MICGKMYLVECHIGIYRVFLKERNTKKTVEITSALVLGYKISHMALLYSNKTVFNNMQYLVIR